MDLVCEICVFGIETVHFRFSLFEEFHSDLFKERIRKNVFVLDSPRLNLFAELVKLGSESVCGTGRDGLFVADDLLAEFGGEVGLERCIRSDGGNGRYRCADIRSDVEDEARCLLGRVVSSE